MSNDPWWASTVLPAIFVTPWIVAAVWIWMRTPRGDGTPAPSMGELARRRLNIR
jgi:hypothetical protein